MPPFPSTRSYILRSTRRRGPRSWAIAVGALAGAVALVTAFHPHLGANASFMALFGAVAIAVWLIGGAAATAFAAVGYVAYQLLLVESRFALSFADVRTVAEFVAYMLTCGFIITIGETTRTAQDQAHERGELLRVALANIDDAVIAADIDTSIIYLNESAEVLTGWSYVEARGHPLSTVFRLINGNADGASEAMPPSQVGPTQESAPAAMLLARDGVARPIEHSSAPIKGGDGLIAGCVVTFRDVSQKQRIEKREEAQRALVERRALEERVRALAASVSEGDRRRSVFLETLAHELSNSLAPLTDALDIFRRAGDAQRTTATAIHAIERQTAQIARLANNLLDLSFIGQDKLELRKSTIEIGAVVRQAVESCRAIAEAAGHEVRTVLPLEPVYMRADGARLLQVFSNLIANRCGYTGASGTIVVTAQRDGGWATVAIEDDTGGIAQEKLDSIIEMFERIDASLEQAQDGLGIGLTLAAKLVAMHGGSVKVESSRDGTGAKFIVRLPIEAGSPSEAAPVTAKRFRRVLVVDDNREAAASLATLLQLDGHPTFIAHDGAEALVAAERHRPDVVLLDIGMPILNGYEVCRRLRERPYGKDMLIVALTARGQASDRERAREAGFDGHFVKPANYGALAVMLASGVPPDPEARC